MKRFLVSLALLVCLAFFAMGCDDEEKKEDAKSDQNVEQEAPKDHPAH